MFAACNTTLEDEIISETPLWENGMTFHHLGLWISAGFGIFSVIVALLLVFTHATHYSKPWEQRHIIRILLMIPIYSTVSFLSYLYYQHAVYFEVLRDCYEAFAIASFFTLLCHYIAPTLHEQKEFFRSLRPVNWFWSVFGLQYLTGGKNKGLLRMPRSGLTWFNVIWVAVFQYCIIRIIFTIVSVVTQYFDLYCEASLSPVFAHVWVQAFEALSVTIAMFCLVQFYIQLRNDLATYKPFLKVLCIKLVIFFSFWQTLVISFLSSSRGPLQPTATLAYQDIKIGIPSVLLCIEMAIFSIMHIFAFPWQPYRLDRLNSSAKESYHGPCTVERGSSPDDDDPAVPTRYQGGPLGVLALVDAFNPWDMVKATARGLRWLFVGRRSRFQDESYRTAVPSAQGPSITAIGAVGVGAGAIAGRGGAVQMYGHVAHDEDAAGKSSSDGKAGGKGKVSTDGGTESDQAGLLAHQGARPLASPALTERNDEMDLAGAAAASSRQDELAPFQPYRPQQQQQQYPSYPSHQQTAMPMPQHYGGLDPHQDTSYHGATGAGPGDGMRGNNMITSPGGTPAIGLAIGGHEEEYESQSRPVTPNTAKVKERERRRREEFERQQEVFRRQQQQAGEGLPQKQVYGRRYD